MRQRFIATALGVLAGIVAAAGALAVVGAAFTLSFDALRDIATAAHIRASLAWLYPVAVDGAMAVGAVAAVVLRRMGRPVWYPWTVVVAGAAISIVANGLHAYVAGGAIALPARWAMTVSAVPPLLLALSVHLLIVLAESVRHPGRQHPAPVSSALPSLVGKDLAGRSRPAGPAAALVGVDVPVPVRAAGPGFVPAVPGDPSTDGPMPADGPSPGNRPVPSDRPGPVPADQVNGRSGPHRPAGRPRTTRPDRRVRDRAGLEQAARTVHARLAASGVVLTRQTLTEGLRRDGHPVSNATAGQLLTVLRARPDPDDNGDRRTVAERSPGRPADHRAVPNRATGDQPATVPTDRTANGPGPHHRSETDHGPSTG